MANGSNTGRTVKSDETLLEIVLSLRRMEGAGVTELADELGIAKSTVHTHLATLHDYEFVVKEDGTYRTGLRFLDLGEMARQRREEYQSIEEKVKEIAVETGERTQFIVPEHGRGVYLFLETGDKAVQTDAYIGKRIALNASAAGKSILANLPEEVLEEIVSRHGLPSRTEKSITDLEELLEELETIRDRGYALNRDEATVGLRAVGVPVFGAKSEILGAISVSAPAHRMISDRFDTEIPNLIMGVANELELNFAFS